MKNKFNLMLMLCFSSFITQNIHSSSSSCSAAAQSRPQASLIKIQRLPDISIHKNMIKNFNETWGLSGEKTFESMFFTQRVLTSSAYFLNCENDYNFYKIDESHTEACSKARLLQDFITNYRDSIDNITMIMNNAVESLNTCIDCADKEFLPKAEELLDEIFNITGYTKDNKHFYIINKFIDTVNDLKYNLLKLKAHNPISQKEFENLNPGEDYYDSIIYATNRNRNSNDSDKRYIKIRNLIEAFIKDIHRVSEANSNSTEELEIE